MKWLYLLLDLGTLMCPLVLSFDKHVRYYKAWKSSILAALIISIPFLIWDIIFTTNGFWGFNEAYLSGIYLFHLPLEEYLFFIVVPFACTFIYEVCKYYFRHNQLTTFNRIMYVLIPLYGVALSFMGNIGYYTMVVQCTALIALVWLLARNDLRYVTIAFLFTLVPFLIMNGILTGGLTSEPVVWYSEAQKVAPRIWTIPMEDILYSFSLVVPNMLLFERFQKKFS